MIHPVSTSKILWRRLDAPGHDACRLERVGEDWRLSGVATFLDARGPARLDYSLLCDSRWRTREGTVRGWVGSEDVDCEVRRSSAGAWTMNGARVGAVQGCDHLDFGFTPATNLPQLCAMDLGIGSSAELTVAWIDAPAGELEPVLQRYERIAANRYAYAAPRFEYSGVLEINEAGFVRTYPTLWEVES